MRLAILAALAAGALIAWLNVRDLIGLLRRGSSAAPQGVFARPEQPDPMDAVQPADPVTMTVRLDATLCLAPSCGRVVADAFWCDEHKPRLSDDLAPAYTPDMPYLEAVPLAHMRRAFSTQSGPLGPTA